MKKIFTLTAAFVVLFISNSYSQVSFGGGAGLNRSGWKGDGMFVFDKLGDVANGMITTNPVTGFYAGGYAEIPITAVFSVQPGVYYSQKGFSMSGQVSGKNLDFLGAGVTARVQSHYVSMPVLLKANVAEGLFVFAGPQLSYLTTSKVRLDAGLLGVSLFRKNFDITDQFNKADVSLTGGAGFRFGNGMTLTAGYDHGLSRLDKNQHLRTYNRSVNIGLGFTF